MVSAIRQSLTSKFFGVCRKALDLLQINCHVLSGSNHNPMLVKRINLYLNKGLRVMCNECDSIRVALEAILLLLYAWNSCPVPGTDISRSLVAVSREFAFPINFSSGKHWELTSSAITVVLYSKELATRLSVCREVAELLVEEQHAYHCEYINARHPDPQIYSVVNIVIACRAGRSHAAWEIVDKLQFAFTGPWRITTLLNGASYELKHFPVRGSIHIWYHLHTYRNLYCVLRRNLRKNNPKNGKTDPITQPPPRAPPQPQPP